MPRKPKESIQKHCKFCNSVFQTTRNNKLFCCKSCKLQKQLRVQEERASVRRSDRLARKIANFGDSKFARFLVQEAKRAGTTQILLGLTSDDLLELLQLDKDRSRYNAGSRTYAISHLYPVQDRDLLGTLHPKNLVISEKLFNEKRRNKTPRDRNRGRFIKRSNLNPAYLVTDSDNQDSILEKIKLCLGASVVEDFAKKAKLNLTAESTLKRKLDKLEIQYPEDAELPQLQALLEQATKKKASGFRGSAAPPQVVLLAEFNRLLPDDDEFLPILEALNNPFARPSLTASDVKSLLFNAQSKLHGDDYEPPTASILLSRTGDNAAPSESKPLENSCSRLEIENDLQNPISPPNYSFLEQLHPAVSHSRRNATPYIANG